jgi:hypothetical protein
VQKVVYNSGGEERYVDVRDNPATNVPESRGNMGKTFPIHDQMEIVVMKDIKCFSISRTFIW